MVCGKTGGREKFDCAASVAPDDGAGPSDDYDAAASRPKGLSLLAISVSMAITLLGGEL